MRTAHNNVTLMVLAGLIEVRDTKDVQYAADLVTWAKRQLGILDYPEPDTEDREGLRAHVSRVVFCMEHGIKVAGCGDPHCLRCNPAGVVDDVLTDLGLQADPVTRHPFPREAKLAQKPQQRWARRDVPTSIRFPNGSTLLLDRKPVEGIPFILASRAITKLQ